MLEPAKFMGAVDNLFEGPMHRFLEQNNFRALQDSDLKPESRGFTLKFWKDLQKLHDTRVYWFQKGLENFLTPTGERFVQRMLSKAKNPYGEYRQFRYAVKDVCKGVIKRLFHAKAEEQVHKRNAREFLAERGNNEFVSNVYGHSGIVTLNWCYYVLGKMIGEFETSDGRKFMGGLHPKNDHVVEPSEAFILYGIKLNRPAKHGPY